MSGTIQLTQPPPATAPLLPRELWLVYLVAPLAATLLLVKDFLGLSLDQQLAKLASMAVPFAAITLAIHPLYARVMPRLLASQRSRLARAAVHAAALVLVPAVVSVLVRPLHNWICGEDLPAGYFALTGVLIAVIIVVPAMLVQAQRNRAEQVERLAMAERQAALRAQLEALQARTNPHFFFNSINTVASLIHDDPALAERTLERLADLFRYALEGARTRSVPLRREFEMATDFLAIQEARFGARLESRVSLDPALAELGVPPLLLQPLLENAILHGLSTRKSGRVSVTARKEGDRAVIEVSDDGPGPGASSHRGTQTSMRELSERLRLAFGEGGVFTLEPAEPGGCCARVAIPLASPT